MTTKHIILSVIEFLIIAITIYYIFNEYKLINFENKIKVKIKKFLEVIQK
jgi:hypothetical protein